MAKDPERIAEMVTQIRRHRITDAPFEVAVNGYTDPGETELARAYEEAGATWWLESVHGMRGDLEDMMRRVRAGPPG
jgi:hypothetical protein